jgi:hypothetical protein
VLVKIIVEIDGREALPLRAIPLATNWETLSPDELAGALAKSDEHAVSFRGLVAYHLQDGQVIPIKPIYWANFTCRQLDALHEKLKAQEDAGTITPEEGYQQWRQASLPTLPPGAFVWRDEFEPRYLARYGSNGMSWVADPYDGDGVEDESPRACIPDVERDARAALDFDPFIHSAELRALVLEGFSSERPAIVPHLVTTPAASPKPVSAKSAVARQDGGHVHSTRTERRNVLTPLIEKAVSQCSDGSAVAEVWPKLQRIAISKEPPFLGGASEDGLQYEDGDKTLYLTKKQLADRLRRRAKAR